jgi:AraC-like DNA-binding protein
MIQVESGIGYCLLAQSSLELQAGAVVLVAAGAHGIIRASQLEKLTLRFVNVIPTRLTGLLTVREQEFLRSLAARADFSFRVFSPQSALAAKMQELYGLRGRGGLFLRLQLLQLFVEAFGDGLQQNIPSSNVTDAKERLRIFLNNLPQAELSELTLTELARMTHCTSRHVSRIFHELVGMPFREKRAELRLERARELLATSRHKVVEVALESGFNSLSLFNLMFMRRYGTSPGRWRTKYRTGCESKNPLSKSPSQWLVSLD